jgi:hypothetical protein
MDAFWRAPGNFGHDDLAFERPEDYKTEFGWWLGVSCLAL